MELKVKFLKWSAGIPVAMINQKTANKMGVHTTERISVRVLHDHSKELSTIVDIIGKFVGEKEIVVSSEIKEILGLKQGQIVDVSLAPLPHSLIFIKEKLNGKVLKSKQIFEIIHDIVSNSLSEAEIALFVSATYKQGMNFKETVALIEAILDTGNKLKFEGKYVVDKHCIGGVAGNRTTPLVVSICAAGGLTIPKSSSRAITSASGTADVIETIAEIEFSSSELKKIVKKTNGCMIWGGSLEVVTADSKIIQVEKMLKIDPEAQLLASIMSKKLAMGSKYILIDIPCGNGAKVSREKALGLKKKFEKLGRHFKKKLKVVLTDGSQPVGNGIGPALELIDVIKVLDPNQDDPKDLRKKAIFLSGELFELSGKVKKGKGKKFAEDLLNSGKAFNKFKEIIKAQKGSLKKIELGKFRKDIVCKSNKKIKSIDNKLINSLAWAAGCPVDKFSGVYLYSHVGKNLKKREKILTIYAQSNSRLREAVRFYKKMKPIKFG